MKRALILMAAVVLAGCSSSATPVPTGAPGATTAATTAATPVPAATVASVSTAAAVQSAVVAAQSAGIESAQVTDTTDPITVWIDQPRQPVVDGFKKKYPQYANLVTSTIVDRETFPSKTLLFNNTGSGWPDVVFAEPRLVGRVADAAHNFPLDLSTLVPADNCTFNGKVYCLRNDLAQMVTYYNAPLFTQFGYTVPTTFEEMQALSDKVAKDHPGYYLGTLGDGWTWLSYFEAAGCPYATTKDVGTLLINVSDPNCTRAAQLIDHMVANKTLWNTDYFTASWVQIANKNKLLMLIAPIWAALGTFKGTYYTDKTTPSQTSHVLGVAAPLKWAADATAQTGAMGGAAWTISQHTKNQGLSLLFAEYATQDPDLWNGSSNFPSFTPLQPIFNAVVKDDPIFAADPTAAFAQAATEISPVGDAWPRFDLIAPLTTVVKDMYSKKQTMVATLPEVISALTPLAKAQGYTVVNQ
jgi:ABC-type glycerol-3-phosphate transport system substrate-binding protein